MLECIISCLLMVLYCMLFLLYHSTDGGSLHLRCLTVLYVVVLPLAQRSLSILDFMLIFRMDFCCVILFSSFYFWHLLLNPQVQTYIFFEATLHKVEINEAT